MTRRHFIEATAATAGMSLSAAGAAAMVPPQVKKLRMGIVGGGFGASFHWHEHPNCVVTAVSDLRADRRERLKQAFTCDNVYEDFHPMLKDRDVDAVAIFTEAPSHARYCLDVLKAGKHVISAVPSAWTLDECGELVEAVNKTGLCYMLAETSCFHSATMSARRLRLEGQFGTVYYTQGEYLHDLGDFHSGGKPHGIFDPQGKPNWRYGFPGAKYPSHANGPTIFVTGERITKVACIGYKMDHEAYRKNQHNNPFINVTFFCKTTGGNSSRIAIHNHLGGEVGTERAEYWGTKMMFIEPRFGAPALISRENGKLEPFLLEDHSGILPPALRKYTKEGHGGSEVFIVNEFVNACLENRRPLVDVYEGVAYSAPGICALESAFNDGEWIKVPDFGWHS